MPKSQRTSASSSPSLFPSRPTPAARVRSHLVMVGHHSERAANDLKKAFQFAQEHGLTNVAALEQLELQLAAFRDELQRVTRTAPKAATEARNG